MSSYQLAEIDNETVDEVVIGAMSLLADGQPCEASGTILNSADDMTVGVYCDSHQQSAVVLRCSHAFAKSLTGVMLEMEPEEISTADMVDAVGELVNVVAGNLRGLVVSPGQMTAPFLLDQEVFSRFCTGASNSYSMTGESMQILRM